MRELGDAESQGHEPHLPKKDLRIAGQEEVMAIRRARQGTRQVQVFEHLLFALRTHFYKKTPDSHIAPSKGD